MDRLCRLRDMYQLARLRLLTGRSWLFFDGIAIKCAQIYVPYMAAVAAGASTAALQTLVLSAAAQRLQRYEPDLGAFGGFPTGSSPMRCARTAARSLFCYLCQSQGPPRMAAGSLL